MPTHWARYTDIYRRSKSCYGKSSSCAMNTIRVTGPSRLCRLWTVPLASGEALQLFIFEVVILLLKHPCDRDVVKIVLSHRG